MIFFILLAGSQKNWHTLAVLNVSNSPHWVGSTVNTNDFLSLGQYILIARVIHWLSLFLLMSLWVLVGPRSILKLISLRIFTTWSRSIGEI